MPPAHADVRHWVFGYGSLISPASAAVTIGSEPPMIHRMLRGWRRRWNGLSQNHTYRIYRCVHCGGAPEWTVCLNCERSRGSECFGALLGVTGAQLEALDQREFRYTRTRLRPEDFEQDAPSDRPIWIYERKPEHLLDRLPAGATAVLPSTYLELIESAAEASGQLEPWAASRGSIEVPIQATVWSHEGPAESGICRCDAGGSR